MKKFLNKIWNKFMVWYKASNHYKHVLLGGMFLASSTFIGLIYSIDVDAIAINSLIVSAMSALALEQKDNEYGNEFDINDVIATILIPLISVILVSIL